MKHRVINQDLYARAKEKDGAVVVELIRPIKTVAKFTLPLQDWPKSSFERKGLMRQLVIDGLEEEHKADFGQFSEYKPDPEIWVIADNLADAMTSATKEALGS